MTSIIIIGSGGNAYDVLDSLDQINAAAPTWKLLGFLDDARPVGTNYLGLPVLGTIDDARKFAACQFSNTIGSDRSYKQRMEVVRRCGVPDERFATLVHPNSSVSSRACLGRGVSVSAGASVAGGVLVGDHVLLGPGCIIGHNAVIEDYAIVAPGAIVSGFVRIERSCYIGAGARIRQHQKIGHSALVGMGAVVVDDVQPGATVVGVPARPIERDASTRATLRSC